jgi:hypothetical protein
VAGPVQTEITTWTGTAAVKLPNRVTNPGPAALIAGSGYSSLERFATAVNLRGWDMRGIKTSYDHVTVKRWLAGSVCQNPEIVAAVLSDAWGVELPAAVLWPELRDGQPPRPSAPLGRCSNAERARPLREERHAQQA